MSLIGQTVGNYQVTRLLGEGGMGAVYLGEHPVIGRKVAIKVLHVSLARDPEIVARFFNEARAIHTVGDEHIVEILDFGQTPDGQPYFIMEFLAGESINDRIARGPMPAAEVAQVADQVCRALGAAHAKGIVHRDLKPHNVQMVSSTGGRVQTKLLDFGVAKIANSGMGDGSQSVKTRTGSLMGTPLYMSPEQCRGSGRVDHRTDIYSLGVMLFEMLAGRPPFIAEGAGELFAKHMLEEPPSLFEMVPGAPPALVGAIMKSLAKNADDRFASMEDFRGALLGEVPFTPVGAPARAGRTMAAKSRAGGTLAFASQGSTTLSSTSAEMEDDPRPARKGRAGIVIGLVTVAAGGVLAFVLLGHNTDGHNKPVADPTSGPRQETTTTTGTQPPRPETVTIRFEADPLGAHLIRATDEKDLGVVPLELKLPKAGGRPEYLFRLDGYKDKSVTADLASDQTVRVALEKVEAAPPPPKLVEREEKGARAEKSDKGSSPRRNPGQRRAHPTATPGGAGDEDGLATPSF